VGKVDRQAWEGADLVTIAAHKIRGPKGIGALVTRPRVELAAQMGGGAQERGLRPGTQSASLAAGFRVAAERAADGPRRYAALRELRDALERRLVQMGRSAGLEVFLNGAEPRMPHVTSQSWMGWRGAELCAALDLEGVAISSGAACSAGTAEPSAVVRVVHGRARALAAIRLSLGETTTRDEIDGACAAFERVIGRHAERLSR
jgi:cysteine desulfurase